jgi:hypothetical protein
MAFRPTANVIEGIVDNTAPGLVKGWIDFYRKGKEPLHCTLGLDGDFHDDIRGHIIHFWNDHPTDIGYDGSLGRIEPGFMDTMHTRQQGKVGDITADHGGWAYIEWYSDRNGRVILNLPQENTEVLGEHVDLCKLPPRKSHPEAFNQYMRELAIVFRKQMKDPTASVLILGRDGLRAPDEKERN